MGTAIHIKNMVCDRCIRTVERIFDAYKVSVTMITLGVVTTDGDVPEMLLRHIESDLKREGLFLLQNQDEQLVEHIKRYLTMLISSGEISNISKNLSYLIQEEVGREYHYLSTLFSSSEGITIAHYLILLKIEKAKELLVYNEITLSEISHTLGYSSVQHFSGQFKEITGTSPSKYRVLQIKPRTQLDKIFLNRLNL